MDLPVLHADAQLLVVNKPSGVLAQPNGSGDPDVLTLGKRQLAKAGRKEPFLGLVHRLDRPTSGVMVLGRTSAAARHLSRQFRECVAAKEYLAVVEGALTGIGTWVDVIAKIDRQPQVVPADHPEGRHAELSWQALAQAGGCTLLRVQLDTGRPHQIRLQAAERGHPVVGDARYGAQPALNGGVIALHHRRLRVEHPATHRMESFVAPVPSTWNALREALGEALDRFHPS
jgi:tRNA pseudouridine32 synthase/23S rRNA pseudouridine746 synthase/23S rRNA pseudouridine1911/1915/1917 synthase